MTVKTPQLDALIASAQRNSEYQGYSNSYDSSASHGPSFDEGYEAMVADGLINSELSPRSSKVLFVGGTRRGCVDNTDINVLKDMGEAMRGREVVLTVIPLTLYINQMGYLLNGLPYDSQILLLNQLCPTVEDGVMRLRERTDIKAPQSYENWFAQSDQIMIDNPEETLAKICAASKISPEVYSELCNLLPKEFFTRETSFEEFMLELSAASLRLLIHRENLGINVSWRLLAKPDFVKKYEPRKILDKASRHLDIILNPLNVPWLENFRSALKKRGIVNRAKAQSIFDSIVGKGVPADFRSIFKLNIGSNDSVDLADAVVIGSKNVGASLINSARGSINNCPSTPHGVPYVTGGQAFASIIESAIEDGEMAVGLQAFTGRAETLLYFKRLASHPERLPIDAFITPPELYEGETKSVLQVLAELR